MGTGDLSLNPNIRSAETVEFQKSLRSKIVGQDEGVQALVELFQVFTAGLCSSWGPPAPERPALSKPRRKSCLAARALSSRSIVRNFSIPMRLQS